MFDSNENYIPHVEETHVVYRLGAWYEQQSVGVRGILTDVYVLQQSGGGAISGIPRVERFARKTGNVYERYVQGQWIPINVVNPNQALNEPDVQFLLQPDITILPQDPMSWS